MLDVPDPNVMVVAKYEVLPVEVIVRGFMTGVTSTSSWTAYQAGQRVFGDRRLPDNLHKNDELPGGPLVSATTKFEDHDRPLTDEEVVELPGMDRRTWHEIKEKSLALYGLGRRIAAAHNLIIVDTKYEYGRGPRESVLLDEVHTSDSSRYWLNDDYAHRHEYFEEPAYLDKEYVRSWMKGRCDPYADEELPAVPDYIIAEMGRRYLRAYEKLLGQPYQPDFSLPVQERLRQNLSGYRTSHA
jgi:phosphoribosylaminoimidazole-succinocarboxamide synthase